MNKMFNLIDITNMSDKDTFNAYIDNLINLESLSKKHKDYKESKTILTKNKNILLKKIVNTKYKKYMDV